MRTASIRSRLFKADLSTSLYYIGFCILCFINVMGDIAFPQQIRAFWDEIRDALGLVAVYCFVIKLMLQSYTLKSAFVTGMTLILGVFIRLLTGDSTFFFLCLMASCIDGVRLDGLAKILMINIAIAFLSGVVLSAASLTINQDIYDARSFFGRRFALGFSHPNVVGRLLVAFSGALVVSDKGKRGVFGMAALLAAFAISFLLADSRTGSISILCLLLVYCSDNCGWVQRLNWRKWCTCILCLGAVLTFAMMITFRASSELMNIINSAFSYRPEFWCAFYDHYGIEMFGNTLVSGEVLNMYGTDAQLDGAYAVSIIQYGLIATAVLFSLLEMLIDAASKVEGGYRLLAVLAIFLAIALMENYALSPVYNVLLAGIGCCIRPYSIAFFIGAGKGCCSDLSIERR